MALDVKRLIQQIAERPPLWDRRCNDYCQKPVVSKMWKEIASSHSVHEAKVRKRWKALRDRFRQQIRKKPSEVRWPYYEDMLFLKNQFKIAKEMEQPKMENYSESTLEPCPPQEIMLENDFKNTFPEEGPVMGMDYSAVDADSNRGMHFREEDDEDYHFLLSLLPAMRRFPANQKFLFRIKLLELFNKEIYQ